MQTIVSMLFLLEEMTVNMIRPDHGWAWVILLAAFFCNFTFDGIIFSFGVFYLELLDFFKAGRAETSLIGSVICGVYAIIGNVWYNRYKPHHMSSTISNLTFYFHRKLKVCFYNNIYNEYQYWARCKKRFFCQGIHGIAF